MTNQSGPVRDYDTGSEQKSDQIGDCRFGPRRRTWRRLGSGRHAVPAGPSRSHRGRRWRCKGTGRPSRPWRRRECRRHEAKAGRPERHFRSAVITRSRLPPDETFSVRWQAPARCINQPVTHVGTLKINSLMVWENHAGIRGRRSAPVLTRQHGRVRRLFFQPTLKYRARFAKADKTYVSVSGLAPC